MIYTKLTKIAMRIAFDAHKDQTDKSGLPYIFHPFHLAAQMTDEESTCAALLHDVVEDTSITFEDMMVKGIPPTVIEILRLLTHDDGTTYMDYIQKILLSENEKAIAVKLADLRHNSDISRLEFVDDNVKSRIEKYKTAITILERCYSNAQRIYIVKEVTTGAFSYSMLIDNDVCYRVDGNTLGYYPFPDPIKTYDVVNKKNYSTPINPAYKNITIVPGLKLVYPVYDEKSSTLLAKMVRTYRDSVFSYYDEYCILGDPNITLKMHIETNPSAKGNPDIVTPPQSNNIAVGIYVDYSFIYDPMSLIEKRYIVNISENHLQWLPHIFHAFYLKHTI